MAHLDSATKTEFEYVGEVGVDSGQIIVGDPCHLDDFDSSRRYGGPGTEEKPDRNGDYSYSAVGACSASLDGGGQLAAKGIPLAVAVGTSHGDGFYPVFKIVENGRVVAVYIDMQNDEAGAAQ